MDNFIDLASIKDVRALAEAGIQLKNNNDPKTAALGLNKILTCLYLNPSLRTKLSTEIAAKQLGMHCINLAADSAWTLETRHGAVMNEGAAEHLKEQAMVLSEYSDIIAIRAFPTLKNAEEDYNNDFVTKFAKYAQKPIVNLESGSLHPLQGLADLMTIMETVSKPNPKIVLSWAPHPRQLPQSVANSFSDTIQKAGYDLTICCPPGMELAEQFAHQAAISHDQNQAFEDADIIYVKNWSSYQSYGSTHEDPNWMITEEKMAKTNKGAFMHCLPVRRNVVVSDQVIDSPQSIIQQQVNNRIHAAKIVLHSILNR